MTAEPVDIQYKTICHIIENNASVLDLGCGSGELLLTLKKCKGIKGQGIELNEEAIHKCVENGISVFHGDIERGLIEYPEKAFDYVIMNQSMQEVRNVDYVVDEALRVGKKVILGFPNFAYIRSRMRLFFSGEVPVTQSLPYRWYDTPNVHFLSIKDFRAYCKIKGIKIIDAYALGSERYVRILPNLFAINAIYLVSK
jgi:methionine biosynthesis protein MetW